MVTARELADTTLEKLKTFDVYELLPSLALANDGAIQDVLNVNGCANYQWAPGLIETIKPKQVVELGGAMGVWSICVLHTLPEDSKLYSITLAEHGLEYSYIKNPPKNFVPVVGDDLDMSVWPKDLNFTQTDLWYFDSLHTEKQLRAELKLYSPFFKKGAVLLFDDIRMPEIWPVWQNVTFDKVELTNPLHYTGYGMAIV